MKIRKSAAYKYVNFGLAFGLTTAITLYLLYWGGSWLDARWGTDPLFTILGLLLAVGTMFKQLFAEVKELEKDRSQQERLEKDRDHQERGGD